MNKPCCERLKENCIGCDNKIMIDGDCCHTYRAYNQALDDFAKWVNENQMNEFVIDIMIANKGNANIEDLIKLYLSNRKR